MADFTWKGRTRTGAIQQGVVSADSKEAVINLLRKQQIIVTTVTEKKRQFQVPTLGGGVTAKELAIFTRQFSVMIDAGLPLVQCLEILGSQVPNKAFQEVLVQVRSDVESGSTLADALRKHPRVFDDLFSNMVAAGEAGGILDTILQRLSSYIEKVVKLRSAVRSAMIYPTAVIVIAVLVVFIILWKVIPVFADLFEGLGASLPLPTQITIMISHFIGNYFVLIVGGVALGSFLIYRYYQTENGRRYIDGLLLRAPVAGELLRKIAVARFCRTLGTLVSSGVPILDGLDITAKTSGNKVVEEAIGATRKSIEEGKTIAEPLSETKVFPPMVVQMISVGEQTGALDAMLSKIADFYDDEVDEAVNNLLALLEPVMIAFLGVVIGGIVVSMYLPIFELINNI